MSEIGVLIDLGDADSGVSEDSDMFFSSSFCNFDSFVCTKRNLAFICRCRPCNFLKEIGSNFGNCSSTGNGINSSAVQNLSRISI